MDMVMPYLLFAGQCEEAFRFYQEAFGGSAPQLAKYGDSPGYPAQLSDEQKQMVMHGYVQLTETGGVSGCDALAPVQRGGDVQLHVYCPTVAVAERALESLSHGGQVRSPVESNPPPHESSVSGCVQDRYGFVWVLSAQKAAGPDERG